MVLLCLSTFRGPNSLKGISPVNGTRCGTKEGFHYIKVLIDV